MNKEPTCGKPTDQVLLWCHLLVQVKHILETITIVHVLATIRTYTLIGKFHQMYGTLPGYRITSFRNIWRHTVSLNAGTAFTGFSAYLISLLLGLYGILYNVPICSFPLYSICFTYHRHFAGQCLNALLNS
jgi:hypothetical protein